MKKNLFYYIFGLVAGLCSLQAQGQNNIPAPMKDVNQVVDNTLDSLNKARTARPIAGSSRKGIIQYSFWLETQQCVLER